MVEVNGCRINVLGASGSGTSSLGRALAGRLSIAHFESDDYFHAESDPPFTRPRGAEDRYARMMADLGSVESWVLSGGVAGWSPYPELDFTMIVFLVVPTEVRLERLRARERARFGARVLAGGDMFELHEEFIAWAAGYDAGDVEGKTLSRHEAYLAEQRCPVRVVRGVRALAEIADEVMGALRSE